MSATPIGQGFDRVAGVYDMMLWLGMGRAIHRAQTLLFDHMGEPESILLVGGGTGRLLAELLLRFPRARVTNVDVSQGMIDRSRRRVPIGDEERVTFVQADLRDFACEECFDLLVTPFVLDCFTEEELSEVTPVLSSLVRPGGKWGFSDFQQVHTVWLRLPATLLFFTLYIFFRRVCGISGNRIPDWHRVFDGLPWTCQAEETLFGTMIVSRVYSRIGDASSS